MIIDDIRNIVKYSELLPGIKEALETVESQGASMETGRYDMKNGFFMIQKGNSKPMEEGYFEAHRKYIDVQIVVKGKEEIAWRNLSDVVEKVPYDEMKDASYYEGDETQTMTIVEGMFYAMFPHDAHKAVRHTDLEHTFEKVVVKIPVTI